MNAVGGNTVKWINHMLVTGSIVLVTTNNPLFAVYSIAGSVLPDKLEGRPPKGKKAYWRWRKKHRTWSHWPVPYLFLIMTILLLHRENVISGAFWQLFIFVLFFLTGALLHILEDALCGRVPLISYKKKIGLKLFTVDSFGEYFFCITLILILFFFHIRTYL